MPTLQLCTALLCNVQFAILVMVTGAVIAGATDLTFNLPGYIWVAICAVSTAVYLLLIRLLKDKTGARAGSWEKGPHVVCPVNVSGSLIWTFITAALALNRGS